MAESLVLTNPIAPPVQDSTTTYTVVRMVLERVPFARIVIVVVSNTGERIQAEYTDEFGGTTASTLLSALNTANLTIKSLQRRVLEKLASDGKLPAGAVSGTPD